MFKKYIWNLLISIDQFFNTLFAGDPDETMSSRFGKWLDLPKDTRKFKIAKFICKILHHFQNEHCRKSIEEDEGKNDLL